MKLKCEESLSNFAFNFNLRRYSTVHTCTAAIKAYGDSQQWEDAEELYQLMSRYGLLDTVRHVTDPRRAF